MAEIPLGVDYKTGKNYTVMIIDDSSTIRVAIKKVLASESFTVILEAENGKNALSKLKATGIIPDLILLDFEMPQMNGVEFLSKIRESKLITSKVIIVSTISDKNILEKFLALGVDNYVLKPIERKVLLERISKVLQ